MASFSHLRVQHQMLGFTHTAVLIIQISDVETKYKIQYCYHQSYSCKDAFILSSVYCGLQNHTQILSCQFYSLHNFQSKCKSDYITFSRTVYKQNNLAGNRPPLTYLNGETSYRLKWGGTRIWLHIMMNLYGFETQCFAWKRVH